MPSDPTINALIDAAEALVKVAPDLSLRLRRAGIPVPDDLERAERLATDALAAYDKEVAA
jgi:hypothetical protein